MRDTDPDALLSFRETPLFLLHIYGKREQATLTASDKKKIKAVIDSLRREELL